ncbi:MAG TPA: CGNR zinc finger domain-containing protein [Pyrinomonadaceae bacterium]|nr:CGNR zinc finger domain-containing protein [Pyrinomonadaceae bacterium]
MRNAEPRLKTASSLDEPLCLSFANTVHNYGSDDLLDDLTNYSALAEWACQRGIVTNRELQRLRQEASRRPKAATTAFKHAIVLRETIYRALSATIKGPGPEMTHLAVLNSALAKALSNSRIIKKAGGFALGWDDDEYPLTRVVWPVVRSTAELLTSGEMARLRECAGIDCTWLFLDRSKNQARRWCDMKGCGNRVKARRHYERQRLARLSRK